MVEIEILTAVWSQLKTDDDDALRLVADYLTVESPSARFSKAARFGQWDGMVRLLRRPSNMFQTGLVGPVATLLTKHPERSRAVVISGRPKLP